MSHQPFEAWILDQEPLSIEEQRALHDHLDTCKQCLRLQWRWHQVQQELSIPKMIKPQAGFTQRWQAGLKERRVREQRKQAWKIAGLMLGAALLILLFMASYTLVTSSPTEWLVAGARTISSTTGLINLGIHFTENWLSNTPLAVNIVLWIYLTVSFCLLTFIWVLILWRTNILGVFNR